MRTLLFATVVFVFGTVFTSCLDDDNTPPRYVELAQTKLGASDEKQMVSDSKLTLQFNTYPAKYEFEPGKRVLVKYSVAKKGTNADSYDYLVDVFNIKDIVLKNTVELNEVNRDTIGDDQILIERIWIAAGYLNVSFFYYGNDKAHYINVVKDPEEQTDDPGKIYLQVRHDARDDDMKFQYWGLMSFYLESLQVEGKSEVTLIFDNQSFYAAPFSTIKVEYKYGDSK
jgi:hypothetical protein